MGRSKKKIIPVFIFTSICSCSPTPQKQFASMAIGKNKIDNTITDNPDQPSQPTPTPDPVAALRFSNANSIFQTNCIGCHADMTSLTTEAEWLASGYVTTKNLSFSKIYYRLNGAGIGVGNEDMPLASAALSDADMQTIRDWINGIE